jgi:hypothetical protein
MEINIYGSNVDTRNDLYRISPGKNGYDTSIPVDFVTL